MSLKIETFDSSRLTLIGNEHLKIGDETHPIQIRRNPSLPGGISDWRINFEDELEMIASARLLKFTPRQNMLPALLSRGTVVETVIEGGAWTLFSDQTAAKPQIQPYLLEVDSHKKSRELVYRADGLVRAYFAGDNGATVLSLYTPPFKNNMESLAEEVGQVAIGKTVINVAYWNWYRSLSRLPVNLETV